MAIAAAPDRHRPPPVMAGLDPATHGVPISGRPPTQDRPNPHHHRQPPVTALATPAVPTNPRPPTQRRPSPHPHTMITAGLGCRKGCTAAELVALIRGAGHPDRLAAPYFKHAEPGLHEAAAQLGLPLTFIPAEAIAAAQPHCLTRSAAAARATGHASIAEAAALAAGGTLLGPRIASANATCALAQTP